MNSSRLPGKVMMKVLDKPMLIYLVDNLKTIKSVDQIVIATTINKKDDILCDLLDDLNISYFRGDEEDVLGRVTKAAVEFRSDVVVQLTGDNPLIDPKIIEKGLSLFFKYGCDCVSNAFTDTFPSGMNVTIFKRKFLEYVESLARDSDYREHVPLFTKVNKKKFNVIEFFAEKENYGPEISVTVDEKHEFEKIKKIIDFFGSKPILCKELIKYIKSNEK